MSAAPSAPSPSPSRSPRPSPPAPEQPAGIYLHFPFCSVRCSYCDFPTVAGRDDRIAEYLDALEREIRDFQPALPREVDSVFLGGGTPSRMAPAQTARVLRAVRERFDVSVDCEVTLEANPEDLDEPRLGGFLDAGVTRISIGVQSLHDSVLAGVGRGHDVARSRAAVRAARAVGFPRVSVDLIAGLPGEDLSAWRDTVERAATWGADHVSVYLLETDKDTPLARAVRRGRTRIADDDAQAAAYADTTSTLRRHGFEPYEISNFARPGCASRHNRKYWTDAPYGGFGLGAHGYCGGARRANRKDLDGYLEDLAHGRDPCAERDAWDARRRLEEALVLGLRLVEGVDLLRLGERYGVDVRQRYRTAWQRGIAAGLLRLEGPVARLTESGRVRSSELFVELLSAG